MVVSPGDGKVIAVQEEFEPRFLKDQAIRISIFLNVFDVHINRTPCAGTITDITYQPGQFLAANRAEATIRNEQNALLIETPSHHKVLCVQVAGLIARRIVCWAKPGDSIQTGERFGLIRFGSRVDLFLPKGSKITIEVGDRVKGGESVLGELVCVDPS
jgi:phosphatidylserine decarboxylase